MARSAKAAFNAGAGHAYASAPAEPDKGHMPSLGRERARRRCSRRSARPVPASSSITTTGVIGPNYQGALDCVRETEPEMAACNAGSLNYLEGEGRWLLGLAADGVRQRRRTKIQNISRRDEGSRSTLPEFECFDVGIVRSVAMYKQNGMYSGPLEYNFVMGVASGMPADPSLLPILLKLKLPDSTGALPRSAARRSGLCISAGPNSAGTLRTGLEDTLYLGNGAKVTSNGQLIEGNRRLCAASAGREIASPGRSAADSRDEALKRV